MTGTDIGVLKFTVADVGVLQTGMFFVKHVRVVGVANIDDVCILKSASGSEIFKSVSDGPNFTDAHPFYRFFNGIELDTLTSGEVYVTLA